MQHVLKFDREKGPIILLLASLVISLAFVAKVPESSGILFAALSRFLQSIQVNAHADIALILRWQEEFLRNLATQITAKADFFPMEIRPRSLTSPGKIRYLLMVAAVDVSVIVPTWNEEKYLRRCLTSLLNQSRKRPAEIIVVDGGSEDRTVQIAREYASKVLVRPGQPVGAARNLGAREARGDIFAFIDADTVASDKWLEEIAHTFRHNMGAVGVTGPTLPYEGTRLDQLVYHVATGYAQRLSLRLGRPHVAGFNCAYPKAAFWNAGGFDEIRELSEDVMLGLRIGRQGRLVFNPEMIAYTSLRRIKKYGYAYLTTYYLINALGMLLANRTLAYPKVR